MSFRVLHVCTGNICRSPMTEHLMRAGLEQRGVHGIRVESAGTMGFHGEPMQPYALSTLASHDIDGTGFRGRELLAEHVAGADLVLTASREHRASVVVLQPRAAARTFTLREFARLTSSVEPAALPSGDTDARARALVRAAAGNRGLVPPASPRDDDLEDPYRSPEPDFVSCAALVQQSLQGPLDLLAG